MVSLGLAIVCVSQWWKSLRSVRWQLLPPTKTNHGWKIYVYMTAVTVCEISNMRWVTSIYHDTNFISNCTLWMPSQDNANKRSEVPQHVIITLIYNKHMSAILPLSAANNLVVQVVWVAFKWWFFFGKSLGIKGVHLLTSTIHIYIKSSGDGTNHSVSLSLTG